MGKFDKDSIIKFVKTNSVDFAAEFPWFNEWLQKNASKIIEWEKRSILRPNRNPVIPSFPEGTPVAVLNRTYFLDDIKTVFFRGIPYSCPEDFITRADFTDSSVFSVDASTGIKDGDTIAETMTKINDSVCWIDLEDDPSVFTTNEGDRLLYNNE